MNKYQRAVLTHRSLIPSLFIRNRTPGILRALVAGLVLSLVYRVASRDPAFHLWMQDDTRAQYARTLAVSAIHQHALLLILILALVALLLPNTSSLLRRCARSWISGVWGVTASATALLAFVCPIVPTHLAAPTIVAIALATDIAFFYRRQLEKLMTLDAKTLLVLRQYEEPVRTRKEYEDDAISHWSQDKLNRSALVDIIRVKVLVGEVPTFAVRGKYGSGKSSLLNLLQLDLQGQAIVARFSTWLPGSENTLTNDLVQDIAKECRKHYHIPGIRRAAVRYARVFSTDVPYFKGLHELLTPPTQREEINAIKEILDSLPKRVVVLLDEIDRMRRKELLTLLKLIRGMDGIPNLTFVCAFDREKVEQIACKEFSEKSHEYFEKFFPNGIDLPDLDQDALKADFLESMLDPDLWSEDNDEI